jgi:uncharacterized protein YjcR
MRLYAYQRAKLGDSATEVSIAEKINIRPPTISNWKTQPGFLEWLETQVSRYRAPILDLLEQVAIDRLDDYRYWEAMAKKYGLITKDGSAAQGEQGGVLMSNSDLIDLIQRARVQPPKKEEGH